MSMRIHPRQRRGRRRGPVAVATLLTALLAWTVPQPPASAQLDVRSQEPTPGEKYAAMQYGVFLHYGLATYVGRTPWAYDPHDVPPTTFNPPDFDPGQWMDAIKASGANYIVLTAKHHDGFALWRTDTTDYGVKESSVPDTDVVGEVAAAARERGLKVVLYYSWHDKYHPGGDVRPKDPNSDRTATAEYLAFAKTQISELLHNYGHIEGIWLDIAPLDDVQLPELADYVHTESPGTALIPNFPSATHETDAADVRAFEGPYEMMPCGYAGGKPTEQAFTVSAGPGWWQASDTKGPTWPVSSVAALRSWLAAEGVTLSLNVSPGPSGQLPQASVEWLHRLGATEFEPGDPFQELPDGRLAYDDGRSWCGQSGGIQYRGAWKADYWPDAHAQTRHYSRAVGATATLTFTGTGVQVLAQTRPGHGIAAISIDGGPPQRVDTYSAVKRDQVVVWERTGLPQGRHTVRIEVTGDRNPEATNRWIGLDAIAVTP